MINQHIAASIPNLETITSDEIEGEILSYYDDALYPLIKYGKDMFPGQTIPNYVAHAMLLLSYDLQTDPDETTTGIRKAAKLAKQSNKFLQKQCRTEQYMPDNVKLTAYSYLFNSLSSLISSYYEIEQAAKGITPNETEAYESLEEVLENIAYTQELPSTIDLQRIHHDINLKLNNIPNNTPITRKLHELSARANELLAILDERDQETTAEIIPFPTLEQ